MSLMNEWTLTSDIAKWTEEILRNRLDLPFSRAEVEERGKGTRKRRDLTIYGRDGKRVLTGELKMPDSPEGSSPFRDSLVMDAHDKADNVGVEYFFTCNVNRCVLWKTFEQGKPITERHIEHFYVIPSPIRRADDLLHPRVQEQIRQFLEVFLGRCAAIMSGAEQIPSIPLDEKFLLIWEAALEQPVYLTLSALSSRYETDKAFTTELDKWMREQQGWIISHKDDEIVRDNLERAAKFSCYVLANKIIFYKALRRRFSKMRALSVPDELGGGKELSDLLSDSFEHARQVSRDYETVFNGDFGDTLPFINDAAVGSWRELIRQTDGFDFTKLDYEIIGQVFERMLSTEERHKFGQHYTRSEVVDLINAFCVRTADATVLDPSCGGGTFLVRAYMRKRELSCGKLKHEEIIRQLYGVDISAYPAHLTTINLATRDLIDRANYPLVARKDFFDIGPGQPIFHVPLGSEDKQITALQIERVSAIVGNPPYVRQEKIGDYYGSRYKARIREQSVRDVPGSALSGRSDIHCYFFTHGLSFLQEHGYMGLLTSSTWLDTAYGFQLQKLLLDNFEILAIFESDCEPWFSGARVTTAATILRRQSDPEKRASNKVKFVQLTKPISELLTYSPAEADRRITFEKLRERIEQMEGTEHFTVNLGSSDSVTIGQEEIDGMRVRIINQGDLQRLGCTGISVSEADEDIDGDADGSVDEEPERDVERAETADMLGNAGSATDYTGYKWGILLRAPNIFFELLRKGSSSFVQLGNNQVARIKRGVTSGCDKFFFVKDITDDCLNKTSDRAAFKEIYGISRHATDRIRIVLAGDRSAHLIEDQYLKPVLFNLMQVSSTTVDLNKLQKRVLAVSESKEDIRGSHLLKYIRWGEREGFDERPSCRGRDKWYSLGTTQPSDAFWSKSHRYRHIVVSNQSDLPCNCNLYDIWAAPNVDPKSLCAILNSTVVCLSKHLFGRMMGGDPMLKTEVVDVKMMLVPDPRLLTPNVQRRLLTALDSIGQREISHLVSVDDVGDELTGELACPDRQELDDAVLELLGVNDPAERTRLREQLYAEMTRMYRAIRSAEKRMQAFRSRVTKKGRPTARSIATEIWESFETKPDWKTVLDFVTSTDGEEIDLPEGKAKVVDADLWTDPSVQIGRKAIVLGHISRARFAKSVADSRIHGIVRIPYSPEDCQKSLEDYEVYLKTTAELFAEVAATHTSDEEMQQKIVKDLWRLVQNTRGEQP